MCCRCGDVGVGICAVGVCAEGIVDERESSAVGRPAVHVDGPLPAEQPCDDGCLGPAAIPHEPQLDDMVGGVTFDSGRIAEVHREIPGRGEVREPVHPLVGGQLLQSRSIGADAGDLGMTGDLREALGVEVDPLAVGRELRPVVWPASHGEGRVAGAVHSDGAEVRARPPVLTLGLERDVREGGAVRAHTVEEVQAGAARRDPPSRTADERRGVELPVVRRQIDRLAVRCEHMVVVQLGDAVQRDRLRRAAAGRHAPQQSVAVDDELIVVRPVRRLEEHRIADMHRLRLTGGDVEGADAASLTVGECARVRTGKHLRSWVGGRLRVGGAVRRRLRPG